MRVGRPLWESVFLVVVLAAGLAPDHATAGAVFSPRGAVDWSAETHSFGKGRGAYGLGSAHVGDVLGPSPLPLQHAFAPSLAVDVLTAPYQFIAQTTLIARRAMDWDVPPTMFDAFLVREAARLETEWVDRLLAETGEKQERSSGTPTAPLEGGYAGGITQALLTSDAAALSGAGKTGAGGGEADVTNVGFFPSSIEPTTTPVVSGVLAPASNAGAFSMPFVFVNSAEPSAGEERSTGSRRHGLHAGEAALFDDLFDPSFAALAGPGSHPRTDSSTAGTSDARAAAVEEEARIGGSELSTTSAGETSVAANTYEPSFAQAGDITAGNPGPGFSGGTSVVPKATAANGATEGTDGGGPVESTESTLPLPSPHLLAVATMQGTVVSADAEADLFSGMFVDWSLLPENLAVSINQTVPEPGLLGLLALAAAAVAHRRLRRKC